MRTLGWRTAAGFVGPARGGSGEHPGGCMFEMLEDAFGKLGEHKAMYLARDPTSQPLYEWVSERNANQLRNEFMFGITDASQFTEEPGLYDYCVQADPGENAGASSSRVLRNINKQWEFGSLASMRTNVNRLRQGAAWYTHGQGLGPLTVPAEVVRVEYDPVDVTFQEIVETSVDFWINTKGGGPCEAADYGPQYRAMLFWRDQDEKDIINTVLDSKNAQYQISRLNTMKVRVEKAIDKEEENSGVHNIEEYLMNEWIDWKTSIWDAVEIRKWVDAENAAVSVDSIEAEDTEMPFLFVAAEELHQNFRAKRSNKSYDHAKKRFTPVELRPYATKQLLHGEKKWQAFTALEGDLQEPKANVDMILDMKSKFRKGEVVELPPQFKVECKGKGQAKGTGKSGHKCKNKGSGTDEVKGTAKD